MTDMRRLFERLNRMAERADSADVAGESSHGGSDSRVGEPAEPRSLPGTNHHSDAARAPTPRAYGLGNSRMVFGRS
jgi:hypothetical protein